MKADPFAQLRLLDLQALDSALDRLAHRRRTLPELAEIDRLEGLVAGSRDDVVRAETQASDLARETKKFEDEITQVRTRKARNDQRMASGAITQSKQLDRPRAREPLAGAPAGRARGPRARGHGARRGRAGGARPAARRARRAAGRARRRGAGARRRLGGDRRGAGPHEDRARHRRARAPGGPARAVREDPRGRGRRRRGRDQPRALRRLPPGPHGQRDRRDPRGAAGRGAAARGVHPDHGAHRRVAGSDVPGGSSSRPTAARAATPGPAGYGAVVRDAVTGEVLAERAAGIGTATNNVAEYGGLIAGLTACLDLDPAEVEVRMDSKLVVEQMTGRWQVKHPAMKPLARAGEGPGARSCPGCASPGSRGRRTRTPTASPTRRWTPPGAATCGAPGGDSGPADAADAFLAAHEPAASLAPAPASNRLSGWQDGPAGADHDAAAAARADRAVRREAVLRHRRPAAHRGRPGAGRGRGGTAGGRGGHRRGDQPGPPGPADRRAGRRRGRVWSWWSRRACGRPTSATGRATRSPRSGRSGPRELEAWLADTAVAPPFGESFDATATRVRQARDRVLATYGGQRVVLVSHVTPIKTLLRFALDAPPTALYRMHLDLACLSEVDWYAGRACGRPPAQRHRAPDAVRRVTSRVGPGT